MLRVHRPKSSHDEDDGDLQRLQEEFLASQVEPSTRVSSSAKKVQQDAAPMEESLLAKVLSSDIIERDPDADYVSAGSFQSPKSVSGFPQVMHRSEFKRRLGTDRKFKRTAIIAPSIPTDDGIHQENMDKITAMGSEEMKASVQELESVLDPSILEMLKKRAAKKYGSTSSDSPSTPAAKQHLNSDKEPSSKNKKFSFSESNSTFQIPSNHDHGSHSHDQEPKEVHLLYFNASGAIVERDEDHSRHLSCADHVAHVDGESYGIPDLLKLTRSVSKELQVKSLTVLHRIVEKALESGYGDQTEKVLQAMYKHEIFLHLRVSLDGKMGSAELGLRILALLVLHVSEESSAWEDIHYTRSRQLAFSFSVDHAQMFKSSALGLYKEEPFEMDGSFESIRKMLKKDIIAGLLVTSITDRFKFFLGLRDLSQETTTHMLEILKVLARHSKQSANKIMETSGLVECLLERLKDPEYGQSLLILFKSLCVVSKGNAEKFAAMGGLERVMRWLTSLNDTPETALSWSLLAVVSNYGLFVPIFSDYRPLIYTKAQSLLKFSNDTETLKSRVGFLKTMTVMATLTVPQTEIGGFDDELKPFVDWALSLFPWKIDWYSLEGMRSCDYYCFTTEMLIAIQEEYLYIHWHPYQHFSISSVLMCLPPRLHRSLKSSAAKSGSLVTFCTQMLLGKPWNFVKFIHARRKP